MSDWLSIETAPRTGEAFEAFLPLQDEPIAVLRWYPYDEEIGGGEFDYASNAMYANGGNRVDPGIATLWRPLSGKAG